MIHILIDTREQTPWSFPPELVKATRATLPAGDYALEGDQYNFAIERKSLDDFVGTITSGWDRFCAELAIMQSFSDKVVIVEGSFSEIIYHKYNHPSVPPKFVIRRIAELTLAEVHVLFADDPISAAGLAWKIFEVRKKQNGPHNSED